jgi:hypothetical protein
VSAGVVVGIVLAAGAAAFVLAPLFRDESNEASRRSAENSTLLDLQSRHDMALAALKDLKDDRSTGKIGDIDYRELKAKLTSEAVEIMKQLDAHSQDHPSIQSDRRAGSS